MGLTAVAAAVFGIQFAVAAAAVGAERSLSYYLLQRDATTTASAYRDSNANQAASAEREEKDVGQMLRAAVHA